jgi:hypothetical protein
MSKTVFDQAVAAMEQRYEAMTPLGDDWIEQCVAAVFDVMAEELKQQASAHTLMPPKWKPQND